MLIEIVLKNNNHFSLFLSSALAEVWGPLEAAQEGFKGKWFIRKVMPASTRREWEVIQGREVNKRDVLA